MPIRVFLVDDHEIVRNGIGALVDSEPDMEVVGEASNLRQAMGRIAAIQPDVAVLDVRMPDGSGIDLCRAIRSAYPEIHCLMLTAYDDDEASIAAVLAGASGYVLKDIRAHRLVENIRRVASGESLVDKAVSRNVLSLIQAKSADALQPSLTRRELAVLELITDGMTNRQIGVALDLAEKTVKNYVSGLFAKLGMERRTQAAVYGAELRRGSDSSAA